MEFYVVQALVGLASASSLFLVASGLSIIFGVTRIVNFAHGAFYMLGAYLAYTLTESMAGALGFWLGLLLAALIVAALGALIEIILLRRIYHAPELFQLLATFGLTLMAQDLVVLIWGPEDLLGRRAPGLSGAVEILGQRFPAYDLMLIALGPVVLGLLWLLFRRTRWGVLVRAATEDREMVAALGVNQKWLFTGVFALGVFLAALGGALQIPRDAVSHMMDLSVIVEAFVVVVIGGLGSVTGAFLAALIVSELNAFGILIFPKISIVLLFLVMAVVLVVRPYGLLGRPEAPARTAPLSGATPWRPLRPGFRLAVFGLVVLAALLPLAGDLAQAGRIPAAFRDAVALVAGPYGLGVLTEALIFALFAASLHLLMGVGGMTSFGHAAYFGFGSYGAAMLVQHAGFGMSAALLAGPLLGLAGAALFGWFAVRLTGVYFAMLTLAFAQIAWSIAFQWVEVTGGDNGILGIWPSDWASDPAHYYWLTLLVVLVGLTLLRVLIFSPFGYALRAARDSALRAEAIGLDRARLQWFAFIIAGGFAGVAGALFAFLKGSVNPQNFDIPLSVDALVMVLLGGVGTVSGAVVGALIYKLLSIWLISSEPEISKLILGGIIVGLVVLCPSGILGALERLPWRRTTPAGLPEPGAAT